MPHQSERGWFAMRLIRHRLVSQILSTLFVSCIMWWPVVNWFNRHIHHAWG